MFNFCWFPTAILESFRFEDENDYKDDINFTFFHLFSKIDTLESFIVSFLHQQS